MKCVNICSGPQLGYPHRPSLQRLPPPILLHLPPPLPQRPPVHGRLPAEGLGKHFPGRLRHHHPLPCQQCDPLQDILPDCWDDGGVEIGAGAVRGVGHHDHPLPGHLLGQAGAKKRQEMQLVNTKRVYFNKAF